MTKRITTVTALKWLAAVALVAGIVGLPALRYRMSYFHEKRFREVTDGKFYRCGQMSEAGFRKQLRAHGIKTVINLRDEEQDPQLASSFWNSTTIPESRVCDEEGVRYVFLSGLFERGRVTRYEATPDNRPVVIDEFLDVCADPANYPILLHCMAGLHRTGLLTAVYRMEHEGAPLIEVVQELRANGFGDRSCTTANDYVYEYLALYKPRRHAPSPPAKGEPPASSPPAKGEPPASSPPAKGGPGGVSSTGPAIVGTITPGPRP